ncbi:VacJ family lipoprotein [Methylophilus sp. 3sh_L]|uniref:MlaA family lipoprotein n=1 Tax=Methylophilus sp. 3sh_L TaxID=3377114 RepID=UPI00398F3D12
MKKLRAIVLVATLATVSGCATTNKDPLEGLNRGIYKFNDVTDRYALKPVAKAYKAVAPSPVRTGISNFFSNLGTLTTVVNDLLQLKFAQAFSDAGRFVINTTFGVAGLIDVASMDNIPKHQEDFGQTLGYWGMGSGAYLVLPILGPSTVRDASGLVIDTVTSDPIQYLHNIGQIRTYNQVRAVQLLDKRTQLLDATDLVDNASIDPYAFMRDAYLQRRASLIQDGLVPKELLQDEFEPADEDLPANKPASSSSGNGETEVMQSANAIAPTETQVEPSSANTVENTKVNDAETSVPVTMDTEAAETTAQIEEEVLPPLLEQNTESSEEVPVVEKEAAEVVAAIEETLQGLPVLVAP